MIINAEERETRLSFLCISTSGFFIFGGNLGVKIRKSTEEDNALFIGENYGYKKTISPDEIVTLVERVTIQEEGELGETESEMPNNQYACIMEKLCMLQGALDATIQFIGKQNK